MKSLLVVAIALVSLPVFAESQQLAVNFTENYAVFGLLALGVIGLKMARRKIVTP